MCIRDRWVEQKLGEEIHQSGEGIDFIHRIYHDRLTNALISRI